MEMWGEVMNKIQKKNEYKTSSEYWTNVSFHLEEQYK